MPQASPNSEKYKSFIKIGFGFLKIVWLLKYLMKLREYKEAATIITIDR